MAITVKHNKVSTVPDGDDTSVVRPSDWNADHTLVGTIDVPNGGTGASTLTGYVKGNGTSAMTASATVPSTDITGLGTMSTQNANAVAITGGTINGTTIGATTPSTVNATSVTTPSVTATDTNLTLAAISTGAVNLNTAGGTGFRISDNGSMTSFWETFGGTGTNILSATGSTSNVSALYRTKGTGGHQFTTAGSNSNTQFNITHTASAVNYAQITGAAAGSDPTLSAQGSDTNINFTYLSKGSAGEHRFSTNTGGNTQFRITHTGSSANYVQVTGAATTGSPVISVQGSDTNISTDINTKGSGSLNFRSYGGSNRQFRIDGSTVSVNYVQVTGAVTGSAVQILAQGSDTNIPLVLQPKGTGALQAQQTDSTATGGNVRGANAVDWQTFRGSAGQVASGQYGIVSGGANNTASAFASVVAGGRSNTASATDCFVGGGSSNTAGGGGATITTVVAGKSNTAAGFFNFIGAGFTNSGTSGSAVTTQSGTMNATTAVTLSGSNASIKVGQYISGTSIAADTYVAAISGTALTLSQAASGSSTSTLSFFTPHGVVVGGGNNQATGSYSFIGGGGDAGTAANRNRASADWSTVAGGWKNTASGIGSVIAGGGTYDGVNGSGNTASGATSFVGGGFSNTASNFGSMVIGGNGNTSSGNYSCVTGVNGWSRAINNNFVIGSNAVSTTGDSQTAILVLRTQTTNATATVLTCDGAAATTNNQVIMPNNSAYYFRGEIISGVTGGGNTKGWTIEGVIKRGANAASTALVGTPTVTSSFADAGASTWTIAVTADTTNGGLRITFTGQASTTIRTVCKVETTEMTY